MLLKNRRLIIFNIILFTLFIVFCNLAIWQYHRFQYKDNLKQQLVNNLKLDFMQLSSHLAKDIEHNLNNNSMQYSMQRFLPVKLQGMYTEHEILLDNYVVDTMPAYKLLKVFYLNNNPATPILIDMGLILKRNLMNELAQINAMLINNNEIIGYINTIGKRMLLGQNLTTQSNRIILQTLDYSLISRLIDKELPHFVIQLEQPNITSFNNNTSAGYALQWSSLAVLVLVYMFIINRKKRTQTCI